MIRVALSSWFLVARVSVASADVLEVGPNRAYRAPCAAFAAAADGDTVEIQGGTPYLGDVCAIKPSRLTIRGVNGRPQIRAEGKNAGGKAIWVIQGHDTLIENVELSGCTVPDANGAGIRQEGRHLTVRDSFFHDNENGILGDADPESHYEIERCEFAANGAGDGYSHNLYIGEIAQFTLRASYSHGAKGGHLVKSRARKNYLLYNRLSDETGGASYELDLPQAGASYVIGNVLQKAASAGNGALISYGRESTRNPTSSLWVVHNTFLLERASGTFVAVAPDVQSVLLRNNIFSGAGVLTDYAAAVSDTNLTGAGSFADVARLDLRLRGDAAAIDHAVAAGSGGGESLVATCQYVHPASAEARADVAAGPDQGAFEYGNVSGVACGATAPTPDAGAPAEPRDAGMPPSPVDASVPAADSGSDASLAVSARPDSGCAVRGPGRTSRDPWWAALAAVLLLRRRRPALDHAQRARPL